MFLFFSHVVREGSQGNLLFTVQLYEFVNLKAMY